MYKNILIPTDGSELAEKAVTAGVQYAREAGAQVMFFTAMPEYEPPSEAELMARHAVVSPDEYARRSRDAAQVILDKVASHASAAGVTFGTHYALSNKPYEAIIEAATHFGCDAIFMASHARTGLAKLLHGSQTFDVLSHTDIPTLVVR